MSDTLLPATEAALAAFRHARTANAPGGRRWLELDGAGLLAAFDAPRRARLAEIGYDVERLEVIRELLGVWAAARADALTAEHTRVPRDQVEIVVQARELRDHLVRACRYHLAHVAGMSLKLDEVANDTGVADLSVDLEVLALVVENNAAGFERDTTFDGPALVAQARDTANALRHWLASNWRRPPGARDRDRRDRAALALQHELRALRAACDYAFPNQDDLRSRFRGL